MPSERATFFPKADAAFLPVKYIPPLPTSRPTETAPILDIENADKPLGSWSVEITETVYPASQDIWGPAPIPDRQDSAQACLLDRYLFPILTRNERLRLTMLYYYTCGALEDHELMSRLQEKVYLARETVGWEFVIAGLLNHNTYTRMVTVGLPLAILPRRESTCAHTVNQPPGTVFLLQNMAEDWRFQKSPHVEQGSLRAYAGVPLRFETEFGDHVVFGSLCVASNSPQEQLSKEQQRSLARLADWIVADLVQSAKTRRQAVRRRMLEFLDQAQKQCDDDVDMEALIPNILRDVYPSAHVSIHRTTDDQFELQGGTIFKPSELEHGLWEDYRYFDSLIEDSNHLDMVAPRIVRVISAQCASQRIPTYLVVGSDDFKVVFDDVDSWFIHMCATLLSRHWQGRELKEALAAKETFMRGITHQLRTPIHGILGSVELLTEELKSRNLVPLSAASSPSATPEVEQLDPYTYIKTIKSSARELITTVNSLIKLNQWADIAQSERAVAIHNIDGIATSLLNETLIALSDDLSIRPSLIFRYDFPLCCDNLAIDLRLFVDTVQPLILNAAQNSAQGVVAIILSIDEDCRTLIVDIKDSGRGIDPINYNRIFGAYEKVNMASTESGLGLTLACKSALLLNGKVELVRSELGNGSHFRATLHDQICASSFPRRRTLRERLVQLPPTFHKLTAQTAQTSTLLLSQQFVSYLTKQGYSESAEPTCSLLILEYTPDFAELYRRISTISAGQVVVCLVPEYATFLNFQGERTRRQDNIIYTQGPFLPIVLEEALEKADAVLAEFAAKTLTTGTCAFGGVAIESSPDKTAAATPRPEHAPELSQRGSVFPENLQSELVQSIHNLMIQTPPPAPSVIPTTRMNKPMTLLVDDNNVNLRLLEMYCNRRGMPYRTARDGQQAVDLFTKSLTPSASTFDSLLRQDLQPRPFELILMDLQMPVLDGIDATSHIRQLEKQHGLKRSVLFIVTGQDSLKDRKNAEQAGSDGYLVKPVGPKALDRWVEHWFPDAEL
ncbi:hypothetical protein ACN47E_000042 [Coniothyrium glycines]